MSNGHLRTHRMYGTSSRRLITPVPRGGVDKFVGLLEFRDDNGHGGQQGEVLDKQDCTGRQDARHHAIHLTREYGTSVSIYNAEGTFLDVLHET